MSERAYKVRYRLNRDTAVSETRVTASSCVAAVEELRQSFDRSVVWLVDVKPATR
jgi:hypothetical protein